ncbi:unnamed protein product [Effrenium voratum]|uniref:Uncharacterized protein n=1 Tax=Effrenium voratum TaxID=2562239 RepID=A0AA36HQE6_9DINO|nr:unnamed protein product [Effrenium voratum]
MALVGPSGWLLEPALPRASPAPPREIRRVHGNGRKPRSFGSVQAALCAACAALRSRQPKAARHAKDPSAQGKGEPGEAPKAESAPSAQTTGPSAPSATESEAEAEAKKLSAAESRLALEQAATSGGSYQSLTADQRGMVNSFFFPDEEELDMDKSMPLEASERGEGRDAEAGTGGSASALPPKAGLGGAARRFWGSGDAELGALVRSFRPSLTPKEVLHAGAFGGGP